MKTISKLNNILFYIFIFFMIILMINQINLADKINFPFSLGYVSSGSMEPTIRTNDGYILVKSSNYQLGDIITFKPQVLDEAFVTHRIIEKVDNGFITQGDHNNSTDQEAGEPLIQAESIRGRVLTVKGRPLTIPKLGLISNQLNAIIKGINILTLIAIFLAIYALGHIMEMFSGKGRRGKRRRSRLIDIAPYFDPVFISLCLVLFINVVLVGISVKGWSPLETSYTVVTTEGIGSPLPGERFTEEMKLENMTPLPFIIKFDNKVNIEAYPEKLKLPSKQAVAYTLTLEAPGEIGYYTESINKYTYLDLLPDSWFDTLYSMNKVLPLIVIFAPGIILNLILHIWWIRRWRPGRRKVMEWMIRFKPLLRG